MSAEEGRIARAAAAVLAPEMAPGFVEAVEAALAGGDAGRRGDTYEPATLIALGGLLVSAASLAWTIYKDLRKEAAKPAEAVVARKVRLRMREEGFVEDARTTRIVEVVVAEVVRADPG